MAVSELVLQIGVFVEHHKGAFPLQVSHEARNAVFGRYREQHMHMVRHQMPLYDLDAFVATQLPQYLAQRLSIFVVDELSPIFRGEHDVVLAHPLRMRKAV